jgi:F-type H+-transporting ATPase subunit delta
MSNATIAQRYAQALYEEADGRDIVETIDDDVDLLRQTLDGSDDLVRFFESPVIPPEKKKDVIAALLEERVHALTYRFLVLLVEKDRETLVASVLARYQALRDEQRNIVEAHVRTAQPLDEDARDTLAQALEDMTGSTVRLRTTEDASLMGGVVVRIGDTVYDGSVRRKLASLRERMRAGSPTLATNGHAPDAPPPGPNGATA